MIRTSTTLPLLALLSMLLTGCYPQTDSDDGGLAEAGSDGGDLDAGPDGGELDAGLDGGADAGCEGCGVCTPDEQRCAGPRIATCDALGRWGPEETCAEGVCRGDACVPVAACASESPPCCALPADCGALEWRFTCDECRPVDAEADCLAGVCEPRTAAQVDVTLRASAANLLPDTRLAIRSGVMTLYRAVASDGRAVDCPRVAAGDHDLKDPTFNVVHSRYLDYQAGTGNDLFDARVRGLPDEPDQTLVLTLYDAYQAQGQPVARACVDGVSFVDGGMLIIELAEHP